MSNIDFACDLFLGKNYRESYAANKDIFKFPNNDNETAAAELCQAQDKFTLDSDLICEAC